MPQIAGINYPGEYEIEINYQVDGLLHTQRHNLSISNDPVIGTTFNNILLNTKSGGTVQADTWVNGLYSLLSVFYPTTVTFVDAVLNKYITGTFAKDFRSTYPIALGGVNGTTYTPHQSAIYTFRSTQGSVIRVDMMETVQGGFEQKAYVNMNANEQALADYITSPDSPVIARDDGYPFAVLKLSYSKNNAIERKRTR